MSKLETIEGIGPALCQKLEAAGVGSCENLLEAGGTRNGRADIAAKTGISEAQILKFVNHADLMRIKGVGGEYSELLEAAGVDSVPELAQRNAANLMTKMTSVNETKQLVRALPSETQLEGWIKDAAGLSKAVHH